MNASMRASAGEALGEDRARGSRGRACARRARRAAGRRAVQVARAAHGTGGRSGARAAGSSGRPPTCGRRSAPSAYGLAARGRASSRHWSGSRSFCEQREASPAGRSRRESRRIQSISLLGRGEVLAHHARGRELEHAGAELAEHRADAEQLVLGGERAGHRLAVDRACARSCATSRSRARRPRCPRARCAAIASMSSAVAGSLLRAALAHHVAAHRAVRHLRADVDARAACVSSDVEVLGEGLPAPLDALGRARRRGCPRRPPSAR